MIYGFGVFNGAAIFERNVGIKRLEFPPAYPPTTVSRYEPSTAIQQFSTGRSHLLGLADNGIVWYWREYTAIKIQLSDMGISEENIARVVAGELRNYYAAENGFLTRKYRVGPKFPLCEWHWHRILAPSACS